MGHHLICGTTAYPFAYRILFSLYYFLFRVSDLGRHFMNKIFPFLYGMVFTVLPFSYGSVSSGLPPRSSYHSFLILNSFCIYVFPIQKFFLRRSTSQTTWFLSCIEYFSLLQLSYIEGFSQLHFFSRSHDSFIIRAFFSIVYFLYRSFFACAFFIL